MLLPNVIARTKRSPLKIQRDVLFALVIRDLRARLEGRWLGLLWMLLEPLAHVMVILAIFGFRRHTASPNVEFPVFLVTGLLPFFMFRNLARRLPGAIMANRGLFSYRQVKPMDALVASAIVEIGLASAVYLSALIVLGWLGYQWLPREPLELMAVSLVLLSFAFGLGLVFSVAAHDRPRVNNLIKMLFMPLYLLSGVIFPPTLFPEAVQQWLLWNPVLHLLELGRTHFVPEHLPMAGVNLGYPAAVALTTMAVGLSLYRIYRFRLIVRD